MRSCDSNKTSKPTVPVGVVFNSFCADAAEIDQKKQQNYFENSNSNYSVAFKQQQQIGSNGDTSSPWRDHSAIKLVFLKIKSIIICNNLARTINAFFILELTKTKIAIKNAVIQFARAKTRILKTTFCQFLTKITLLGSVWTKIAVLVPSPTGQVWKTKTRLN